VQNPTCEFYKRVSNTLNRNAQQSKRIPSNMSSGSSTGKGSGLGSNPHIAAFSSNPSQQQQKKKQQQSSSFGVQQQRGQQTSGLAGSNDGGQYMPMAPPGSQGGNAGPSTSQLRVDSASNATGISSDQLAKNDMWMAAAGLVVAQPHQDSATNNAGQQVNPVATNDTWMANASQDIPPPRMDSFAVATGDPFVNGGVMIPGSLILPPQVRIDPPPEAVINLQLLKDRGMLNTNKATPQAGSSRQPQVQAPATFVSAPSSKRKIGEKRYINSS
jgi:hypothetical protein